MNKTAKEDWSLIYCPILKEEVKMNFCPEKCPEYVTDHCIVAHMLERQLELRDKGKD